MAQRLELAKAIQYLRRELQESMWSSEGEQLKFQIDEMTLELQVELSSSVEGESGVSAWVIEAGAGASRSDTDRHTIKLTMTPIGENGQQRRGHHGEAEAE